MLLFLLLEALILDNVYLYRGRTCVCVGFYVLFSTILFQCVWRTHTRKISRCCSLSSVKVTLLFAFAYCTNLITQIFCWFVSKFHYFFANFCFCFAILSEDFQIHTTYSFLYVYTTRTFMWVCLICVVEESCSALILQIIVFYNLTTILHYINFYSFTICSCCNFCVSCSVYYFITTRRRCCCCFWLCVW